MKATRNGGSGLEQSQRLKKAQVASWVGIIGNLLLSLLQGIIGWISGSRALVADAIHSASDLVSSVTVLIGIRAANKPPDKEHPYGHGKWESISAIVISILLIIVAIEIAWSAVQVFWGEPPQVPLTIAFVAIIISIVGKELMYQYKYRLGKRINSPALIADAWHHRSDVLSSLAVLLGVGGAIIGEKIGFEQLVYLDPIAGIIVAIFIARIGYLVLKESSFMVLEEVLSEEDSQHFLETVKSIPGVIHIDDLRARKHGQYYILDIKISVDAALSVKEGHDIAHHVKDKLMQEHQDVNDVWVHVNPHLGKAPL